MRKFGSWTSKNVCISSPVIYALPLQEPFRVWAQPMRDDVTMLHLSLAPPILRMITVFAIVKQCNVLHCIGPQYISRIDCCTKNGQQHLFVKMSQKLMLTSTLLMLISFVFRLLQVNKNSFPTTIIVWFTSIFRGSLLAANICKQVKAFQVTQVEAFRVTPHAFSMRGDSKCLELCADILKLASFYHW